MSPYSSSLSHVHPQLPRYVAARQPAMEMYVRLALRPWPAPFEMFGFLLSKRLGDLMDITMKNRDGNSAGMPVPGVEECPGSILVGCVSAGVGPNVDRVCTQE